LEGLHSPEHEGWIKETESGNAREAAAGGGAAGAEPCFDDVKQTRFGSPCTSRGCWPACSKAWAGNCSQRVHA